MVRTYRKGYMAERELVLYLHSKGWAALRAPRSGSMSIPLPDVVAIKSGRVISFEVKSRSPGFSMRREQVEELKKWKEMTGSPVYVAVKIPRRGWGCVDISDVPETGYIGKSMEMMSLEDVIL